MKKRYLIFLLTILSASAIRAQNATAWRNGTDGIYESRDLLNTWPESGPEIIWSYQGLGQGHSSPVFADDFIYTAGMTDTTGYLFKFRTDGSLVYKKAYGPEYTASFYGTRGTPVVVGDKVYQLSGYGQLYCMNEVNAEIIWEVDLVNDFGGDTITWGYSETPVVDGDVIYCTPGGENSVVALDRNSGEMIWSCRGEGELSAYCTPKLFVHNGRKILATHTASHLLGIDAKTGTLLWSHKHTNQWSVHANTPIYHNGELFFFSGYGKGAGKLKLSEDGSEVSLVWESTMDSRMGGAVLVDGYIYGSGDNARAWRAINWETGEDSWSSEEVGKGVSIAADGKLFAYSDRGELAMMRISPEKFELLGKTRVKLGSEQHWAHPVIYNGVLYLRHGKALIAYKIN